jgi:hypothetical protein
MAYGSLEAKYRTVFATPDKALEKQRDQMKLMRNDFGSFITDREVR